MKSIITLNIAIFINIVTIAQATDSFPIHENGDSIIIEMAKIKEANKAEMAKADIQYFIIKADSETYGYSIFIDGKIAIAQKTIPSLPGTIGFQSIEVAEKVARFVIQKIREGEMPPTVSTEEMNVLGL
jgi:Domain of unknown function (DUF4907)